MIKKIDSDWREERMAQIQKLMKQVDPEIIEEMKYKKPTNPVGIPVWYREGMICTGEVYKQHLRLTFAKGVALKEHDPKRLINAYRAMIIKEEDEIDETAFKDLIRVAVTLNTKSND